MVFGLNIMALIKAEVLKYKDKAGNPMAVDVLNDIEKSLIIVNTFVSKLTPADIEAILALLPASVAAKFAPGELSAVASAVASLPADIQEAEAALVKVETELESK